MRCPGVCLLLFALLAPAGAEPAPANLLPNPSFERVEPPPPTKESAAGQPVAPEAWLPRTWNVIAQDGATWRCPDDPARARSGRRCAHFAAPRGAGILRYGPMPVPDAQPWTVAFWARGKGCLVAGGFKVLPDRWERLPTEWPFDLGPEWRRCEFTLRPGETCRQWTLDLATRGATEVWLDDVTVAYAGLTPLGLPPEGPLVRDAHTLLYLPFETPFNEDVFFVKGKVLLTREGEGRFGRAVRLGPEGYVACSANENLDPSRGTLELWVNLLSPGSDGVYHSLVGVPGPEGMALRKDQYAHVGFGFCTGWRPLSGATAMGYAHTWQPGVWRHVAACWNADLMQLFVDGKLIAWAHKPALSRALGPELGIGSAGIELDDLRISNVVRYRQAVPPP